MSVSTFTPGPNRHTVKVNGFSFDVMSKLDPMRFKVLFEADMVSIEKVDNHDGTFHYKYKLKATGQQAIHGDGEPIPSKDKKRRSQALRSAIAMQTDGSEEAYEFIMNHIMRRIESVVMSSGWKGSNNS